MHKQKSRASAGTEGAADCIKAQQLGNLYTSSARRNPAVGPYLKIARLEPRRWVPHHFAVFLVDGEKRKALTYSNSRSAIVTAIRRLARRLQLPIRGRNAGMFQKIRRAEHQERQKRLEQLRRQRLQSGGQS